MNLQREIIVADHRSRLVDGPFGAVRLCRRICGRRQRRAGVGDAVDAVAFVGLALVPSELASASLSALARRADVGVSVGPGPALAWGRQALALSGVGLRRGRAVGTGAGTDVGVGDGTAVGAGAGVRRWAGTTVGAAPAGVRRQRRWCARRLWRRHGVGFRRRPRRTVRPSVLVSVLASVPP